MKLYFAARFSRRLELWTYRDDAISLGHEVTSRWLDRDIRLARDGTVTDSAGEPIYIPPGETFQRMRTQMAGEDLWDIYAADEVVVFTEDPYTPRLSRGGRHVEMGYALGLAKPITVIGPYENPYMWLSHVGHWDSWGDYRRTLGALE